MAKMREERIQTIEAHQSRIKQLQDKHQETLSEALSKASKNSKDLNKDQIAELQAVFDAEKIELLTVQKANFHKVKITVWLLFLSIVELTIRVVLFLKQLVEVQKTLQSQIDAARLSRDQSLLDYKKKLSAQEDDFKSRSEKLKSENDQLKTRLLALELKASTPSPTAIDPELQNRIKRLETEISKKDAEIGFLKETVKIECEERMELLATVDSLQRGFTGGVNSPQQTQVNTSQTQLDAALPAVAAPPQEKGTTQYQKLMAMASKKKEQNLKNAAKKNSISQ
ncbi:hypothetical protein BDR26DRAFT_449997 [Obelidium mucronatum]|nr:hypothetical protein BDR26DRAFT_449997 [Obelidium mucronatum]